jgi:hypothetical protein
VLHFVHCGKGKKGKDNLHIACFLELQGIETKMLLFIFLCFIAKLTSVSSDCDIGTDAVNNFDYSKVCIGALTQILNQAALKTAAWFYISFVVPLTNC